MRIPINKIKELIGPLVGIILRLFILRTSGFLMGICKMFISANEKE
jgi:hypothetical protein